MYKFTRHFFMLENRLIKIVGNKYQGTFVKISDECYQILCELLKNSYSEEKFGDIFEKQEDQEYFWDLFKILLDKKILVEVEDKEYIENINMQWDLTKQCNLSCIHCIANADISKLYESDYNSMLRIADQIIELSPQSLTISGGEPMILPHFFELSEYIKKRCEGLLYLITNGTLITEQNAENIAKLFDNVSISIDGVDEETCSKIRGKGVFSKVISGIKYLKNAGLDKISLSMVLTNDNKKYEQKFYDMCDELKVQAYVRVFAPIGRGKEHADLYISSDKEIVKDKVLPNVVLEKKKNNQPKNEIGVCSAEYGSITISAEGNMFLCAPFQFMGQSLGKVADVENLKEYIKLEKYKNTVAYKEFEKLLPENKENCKECNVRYFCWHCSFINEQALKNDEYYLSDCKGKKRDLKFSVWGEQV